MVVVVVAVVVLIVDVVVVVVPFVVVVAAIIDDVVVAVIVAIDGHDFEDSTSSLLTSTILCSYTTNYKRDRMHKLMRQGRREINLDLLRRHGLVCLLPLSIRAVVAVDRELLPVCLLPIDGLQQRLCKTGRGCALRSMHRDRCQQKRQMHLDGMLASV